MKQQFGNRLILGSNAWGNPVVMEPWMRGRHLYMVGSTGSGKSKQMEASLRQDILAWPDTGCGVMLLDPHGRLFDSLMTWMAANDFHRWPIIPIDLRRTDQVVCYNLLRRRPGHDPSVVVNGFVRAILHA